MPASGIRGYGDPVGLCPKRTRGVVVLTGMAPVGVIKITAAAAAADELCVDAERRHRLIGCTKSR
jgi:hypothetical protein